MRPYTAALLGLFALALAALACNGGDAEAPGRSPLPEGVAGGLYLVLGDSWAAGQGASDADATSYAALVAQALRSRFGEALELRSLAVGAQTTEALVDGQLPQLVELVQQGEVRLVTLTIGGQDLLQYVSEPVCLQDPADLGCPLGDGLFEVEQRLDRILRELREAGPEVAIAIQLYPNLFSGTGHQFDRPTDTAFGLLNGVITGVARRHDVLVADPRVAFEGQGRALSHVEDAEPDFDFHPNDAGHRVIADAFLEVLRLSTADEGAN